jgi:hypothetical protein
MLSFLQNAYLEELFETCILFLKGTGGYDSTVNRGSKALSKGKTVPVTGREGQ